MASLINFGPDLPQLGPVSMFAPHGPRRDGLIVHEEPNVAAQMLSLDVSRRVRVTSGTLVDATVS